MEQVLEQSKALYSYVTVDINRKYQEKTVFNNMRNPARLKFEQNPYEIKTKIKVVKKCIKMTECEISNQVTISAVNL